MRNGIARLLHMLVSGHEGPRGSLKPQAIRIPDRASNQLTRKLLLLIQSYRDFGGLSSCFRKIGSSASLFKGSSPRHHAHRQINHRLQLLLSPPGPIRIPKQLTAAERDSKKHLKTCELSLSLFHSDTNFS